MGPSGLPVLLPVAPKGLDDLLDHRGVIKGRQVAQVTCGLCGHLPQHPPHDLPRASLWQPLHHLEVIGQGNPSTPTPCQLVGPAQHAQCGSGGRSLTRKCSGTAYLAILVATSSLSCRRTAGGLPRSSFKTTKANGTGHAHTHTHHHPH